ncbi:hypothetical protein F4778DRAFT_103923 [Xylariomycetidae sp. FL2044]|nr:hypothetical protein F4778DRAFT_103923 [Xylariomycetidae sp. FL2044]
MMQRWRKTLPTRSCRLLFTATRSRKVEGLRVNGFSSSMKTQRLTRSLARKPSGVRSDCVHKPNISYCLTWGLQRGRRTTSNSHHHQSSLKNRDVQRLATMVAHFEQLLSHEDEWLIPSSPYDAREAMLTRTLAPMKNSIFDIHQPRPCQQFMDIIHCLANEECKCGGGHAAGQCPNIKPAPESSDELWLLHHHDLVIPGTPQPAWLPDMSPFHPRRVNSDAACACTNCKERITNDPNGNGKCDKCQSEPHSH